MPSPRSRIAYFVPPFRGPLNILLNAPKTCYRPSKHQARALKRLNSRRSYSPVLTEHQRISSRRPIKVPPQHSAQSKLTPQHSTQRSPYRHSWSIDQSRLLRLPIAPPPRPQIYPFLSSVCLPSAPIDCCHSINYQLYRLYALNTPRCAAVCSSVKRQVLSPFTPSPQC